MRKAYNQWLFVGDSLIHMETRDVFLCHASEDKATTVEPVVAALKRRGLSFWYDNAEIRWGDSVTKKVNEGLAMSRYVIVVLSPEFMKKPWPQRELYSILNIEASTGEVRILPMLCGSASERKQILERLPLLNDKFYITWSGDPEIVVSALLERISASEPNDLDLILSDSLRNQPRNSQGTSIVDSPPRVHHPKQKVSFYLLGEDFLRIGWFFLAVGVGGIFATPALVGLNASMRTILGFGLMMLPATWTGVLFMLTGKFYKEAGHKYPSLKYRMQSIILIPL